MTDDDWPSGPRVGRAEPSAAGRRRRPGAVDFRHARGRIRPTAPPGPARADRLPAHLPAAVSALGGEVPHRPGAGDHRRRAGLAAIVAAEPEVPQPDALLPGRSPGGRRRAGCPGPAAGRRRAGHRGFDGQPLFYRGARGCSRRRRRRSSRDQPGRGGRAGREARHPDDPAGPRAGGRRRGRRGAACQHALVPAAGDPLRRPADRPAARRARCFGGCWPPGASWSGIDVAAQARAVRGSRDLTTPRFVT